MLQETEPSLEEILSSHKNNKPPKYRYYLAPQTIPDIKPKKIWEQLNKKYLEGGRAVENKVSMIQTALRGYGVREKKSYFFKEVNSENSLPLLYAVYLNGEKCLPLCEDKKLLLALQTALQKGEWNNEIFDEQSVSDIARTLFKTDAITVQQFISVLEMVALKKDFDIEDIFPVLNEENQFSEDALHYLCRSLAKSSVEESFIGGLSEFQLDYLRQLATELPPSEQQFYLITPKKDIANHSLFETLKIELNVFPAKLNQSDQTLFWTRGMHDAILATKYKHYHPSMPRHGKIGIYALEEGNNRRERLSSIEYGKGETIDKHVNCTDFLSIVHDYYHTHRFCGLHPKIHQGLDRLCQFIRTGTGISLSSELWASIDRDFTYSDFYGILKEIKKISNSNLFVFAFFVELQQNKQYWDDMGMTEKALLSDNDYGVFKKYYPQFDKDDFKTQYFKYEKAQRLTRFMINEKDIESDLKYYKSSSLVIEKNKKTQNRIVVKEQESRFGI